VQNQLHIGAYIAKKQAVYSLVCFALIFPLEPNFGILSAEFLVFVLAMPTGTFGDVTAYAIRAIFLKRKASALFNRAELLVDSLSSAALTSCDESGLHVRLKLIDELQELIKEVLGELEELDFKEIESDLSEKIDDILVILKSSVRVEISKRASQLLSHSTFADGITPRVFGPQQRQPRHRAKLLPPLELPKFAGSYANGPHQRRKVAASTIMPEGRCVGNYSLDGNIGCQLRNCFGFAAK